MLLLLLILRLILILLLLFENDKETSFPSQGRGRGRGWDNDCSLPPSIIHRATTVLSGTYCTVVSDVRESHMKKTAVERKYFSLSLSLSVLVSSLFVFLLLLPMRRMLLVSMALPQKKEGIGEESALRCCCCFHTTRRYLEYFVCQPAIQFETSTVYVLYVFERILLILHQSFGAFLFFSQKTMVWDRYSLVTSRLNSTRRTDFVIGRGAKLMILLGCWSQKRERDRERQRDRETERQRQRQRQNMVIGNTVVALHRRPTT